MSVYEPAEDSYLLKKCLKKYLVGKSKDIKILDMGSGSGIQAESCIELGFKNILTVDVNLEVVERLKAKGFESLESNLFDNVSSGKFDLIIFNPPYLPFDEREPKDSQVMTTGGKKGNEIILRFLRGAQEYVADRGRILLLFSSLSRVDVIRGEVEKLGYRFKEVGKEKLFFEELFVWEIWFCEG